MIKIGLIGGSGLEKLNIFENVKEIAHTTPYGAPSSTFLTGTIGRCEVYILSRHGRDHTIPPTQVNNRANIKALKQLGCQYIFATTACGSLREEIGRGDVVIADQFIDFTRLRINTFYDKFEPGRMAHTPMADPFSEPLRQLLIKGCRETGIKYHPAGWFGTRLLVGCGNSASLALTAPLAFSSCQRRCCTQLSQALLVLIDWYR